MNFFFKKKATTQNNVIIKPEAVKPISSTKSGTAKTGSNDSMDKNYGINVNRDKNTSPAPNDNLNTIAPRLSNQLDYSYDGHGTTMSALDLLKISADEDDHSAYMGKKYNSVSVNKIDWTELEIITENPKEAIIGHGSYGTVVKARWRPKGKLPNKSLIALEGENPDDGVLVAVKVLTRSIAGGGDFNISKLYQQACEEVGLIRSAEERMFDISCIVHPFGVSKGPLTAEMCRVFRMQDGEEGIGITMRYEAGGSLEALIHNPRRTGEQLSTIEKIRILMEIAKGLAELHAAGIIHADIKTDNVLLSHHRPCRVRLADFGLSIIRKDDEMNKLGQSALTMTTHLRGTPIYCAPELLTNPFEEHKEGEEVFIAKASRKSDMYSYAILMWEVLTQKPPFTDIKTEGQLCTKIHQGHRPPLSDIPVDTPKEVVHLMVNLWDKYRNIRKPSVEAAVILQQIYYNEIKQKPDIFFHHDHTIPKLLISHIYHFFMHLGYNICNAYGLTPEESFAKMKESKVVIVCLDQQFQNSQFCLKELINLKEAIPEKKVLTLIVEEKLMAWLTEKTKEYIDLDIDNAVDIGHIGRAHWDSEEGPDGAMLTALTKNLEPLKNLVIKTGLLPAKGVGVDAARIESMEKNTRSKTVDKGTTAKILAGLELCVAVYEGDLSYLRSLLESGCPVNSSDYDYRTAAHICCAENLIQAALILYEHKADFVTEKVRDRWGRTPLEEAEHHGYVHLTSILKALIESDQERALKKSAQQLAKSNEAQLEKQDCVGLELCVAAFEGDEVYLRALLESGCPVGAADYDLRTAAHISCAENNKAIVTILAEFGADLHSKKVKDRFGNTPLMEAEKHGHTELALYVKGLVDERERKKQEFKDRLRDKKKSASTSKDPY